MLGMPYREGNNIALPAMRRPGTIWLEVSCARARAHLGYLIEGPDKQMLYCVNAAALHFVPEGVSIPKKAWRFCTDEGGDNSVGEDGFNMLSAKQKTEKMTSDELHFSSTGQSRKRPARMVMI